MHTHTKAKDPDGTFLKIMTEAGIGWWKTDNQFSFIILSDNLKELFELPENRCSTEEFIVRVREDYRERILYRGQQEQITYGVGYEVIYPILVSSGEVWVESKFIGKEEDDTGEYLMGYLKVLPNPEINAPSQASKLRINNLLYQLNSISELLLSFSEENNTQGIILAILKDILKQFKGGRTYIFEYDLENNTQSNTYEVVDDNVSPEQEMLTGLPLSLHAWWTARIMAGKPIILNTLEDLPPEASDEKEILKIQNIKSLMVLPLVSRKGIWGYVGIDIVDEHYTWSEEDFQWFSSLVNIICLIIELQRSEQEAILDKAYLQNLYEHMPLGYLRMHVLYNEKQQVEDFQFLDVNYAMENILRQPREMMIGRKSSQLHLNAGSFLQDAGEVLATQHFLQKEYYIPESETLCQVVMYSIRRDEVICLFSDITKIQQAYSRIAEFESSFSLVSKYGKIGYCKYDMQANCGSAVPQWYYNLGEDPGTPLDQIVGIYRHVHDEDRELFLKHLREAKAGMIDDFSLDLRIRRDDGNWAWTNVNVMRNPANRNPEKIELLSVSYDVTRLKETEQHLIQAKEKAEVSDRLKSAFLANMSHEIRTPLNAIVGFSNLMLNADDRADRETYVSIIEENNDLLLNLISDILDLSKIEAGILSIVYDHVDVNQLCEELVNTYSLKMQNSRIKIALERSMPECALFSDKNRIMQILGNFINNALKFTKEGGVYLGYYPTEGDMIKFYVRDTGCGIPEKDRKLIFERFIKLNTFVQGTGLGLSICRSLVEQMGGEIGVDSTEGEGSCFWFTHPLPKAQQAGGPAIRHTEKGSASDLIPKATILIAEDNENNFLFLHSVLKHNYLLLRANNGLEAVNLVAERHVDLVIMDVRMPEMDGLQATREIRKTHPYLPVIAITAFDCDRRRTLEAGCTDFLSKPVRISDLTERIRLYTNDRKKPAALQTPESAR